MRVGERGEEVMMMVVNAIGRTTTTNTYARQSLKENQVLFVVSCNHPIDDDKSVCVYAREKEIWIEI